MDNLKKRKMIFLCNTAWPLYMLGESEVWPSNGSTNYNTILQLDLFCKRQGKWGEIPYVQAFMHHREHYNQGMGRKPQDSLQTQRDW
ncbi:PREDICTED: natural cytotoxicity triggering receptor 3 ligand 1-like [Chrysochloris asiatica]|uniref:Natural cytotoxicity triggering receptor 3 ligand 1-like n=1 Tax=Chrysochloris asiatica TaxID=185453 RepID=A0A9B0TJU2_CHRAS|nr:PREDICTED: natural cytotoxicity triggering receptor 3 ligand 1-like [Chrysochloris asiatica]